MEKQQFDAIVVEAIRDLPAEFRERLENIDVAVEDWAAPGQLAKTGSGRRMNLLGLYEGVPLTKRSRGYGLVLPDKITLFQKAIEARCRFAGDVEAEIRRVLCHEIGHHFGMDEKQLQKIESESIAKRSKRTRPR